MAVPSCLYRSVCGDAAIKNHISGRLWFRSPAYFRRIEGPASDALEGVGSHELDSVLINDISDSTPIQPVFFMSFSAVAGATRKFAEHYFVLRNPRELEQRVKAALPPDITEVAWKKIEYTKTMRVHHFLNPSEAWHRKYFCKPERFAGEEEWRLFVLFRHSLRLLNETMKLHVGDLAGLFQLMRHGPVESETINRKSTGYG